MTCRDEACNPVEHRADVVPVAGFDRATVECHADRRDLDSVIASLRDGSLGLGRCFQCGGSGVERGIRGVADRLEDVSAGAP
jgi:hypothetical protein